MTPQQRQEILREAFSWLGTPYHHHGRLKGVGVDCAGLLIEVFANAGVIERVDPGFYPIHWHLHRSEELFVGWVSRFASPVESPQPGDVGLWRFGRTFSHGGVYVGENRVIHSYINRGVINTALDEDPLAGRTVQWWGM